MANSSLKIWFFSLVLLAVLFVGAAVIYSSPSKTDSILHQLNENQSSSEVERITEMFREGLLLASQNTEDDSVEFGAMLMENALERLTRCPASVKGIWEIHLAHIEKTEASLRYMQIGVFLEYLDRILIYCTDMSEMQNVWHIRRAIVKEQEKARTEIIEQTSVMLKKELANIDRIKIDLQKEKVRDTSLDGTKNFTPSKEGDTWQDGPYQKIIQDALSVRESLEKPDIAPWLDFIEDKQLSSIGEQASSLAIEASRLQEIRYNIWANRIIFQQDEADSVVALDQLSKIDTGLLFPSVYALYSEFEQKKSATINNAAQRHHSILSALLATKIGRNSF